MSGSTAQSALHVHMHKLFISKSTMNSSPRDILYQRNLVWEKFRWTQMTWAWKSCRSIEEKIFAQQWHILFIQIQFYVKTKSKRV